MASPAFLVAYLFAAVVGAALLATGTAYAKATIIFSAIRSGVGLQELLPAVALHAIALIVALSVAGPMLGEMNARIAPLWVGTDQAPALCAADTRALQSPDIVTRPWQPERTVCSVSFALAPWTAFLSRNTDADNASRAERMAGSLPPGPTKAWIGFVFTELQEAMIMAILLLLPFFAVDIGVSCLVSFAGLPAEIGNRIATTAKVLLLAGCGAWAALGEGIIGGYV
jgi:type III secretory pathway component EscR